MDYLATEYNKGCELAEDIIARHKNMFLNMSYGADINIDGYFSPKINRWLRLIGFRGMTTKEKTLESAKEATAQWIRGNSGMGEALAYVITKNHGDVGVYYGTGSLTFDSFSGKLPEAEVVNENPKSIGTDYNGFMLGSFSSDFLADVVLNSEIDECFVACVSIPVDAKALSELRTEIDSSISFLNRFKEYTRVYGTSTRRTDVIENPTISQAIENLNETRKFLEENYHEGITKTIIRFGTQNEDDFMEMLAVIKSCMRVERQNYVEPLRAFRVTGAESNWTSHLAVPEVISSKNGSKTKLLSFQTLSDLKAVCTPPMRSHCNFFVKNYGVDEDSIEVFESPRDIKQGILFGKNKGGEEVFIPVNLMCCHTAILGSAGGGKTTSVKNLLLSLHKKKIPFLVIEAAKKEYFDLSADVPELQIYTPGTNGMKLSINPLQPEDGTLIENQVDMLVRALTAAHGGEHPIPEGFEGLLKMTYEKAGWEYGMLAYHDSARPFPTFEDVYRNVDEYVQGHARYGSENRQNLIAALELRSENLFSGALGRVCNVSDGISAKELVSCSTLIELDDFSESSVVFLMNVILFKLQSYLSKLEKTEELKRVIVVEEAHNVFRKDTAGDQSREITNRYFERMLSEIRASGTGLIISDQRPSILSEALMQNTAIKIVHAMEERNDREVVASSLDLSDIQIKKLRELVPGECVLGLRGQFGLRDVLVNRPETSKVKNAFCAMCPRRFECMGNNGVLEGISLEKERVNRYLGGILSSPFNFHFVKRRADDLMEELAIKGGVTAKCCVLGGLLVKYGNIPVPIEMKRIIVEGYYNLLREEANNAE